MSGGDVPIPKLPGYQVRQPIYDQTFYKKQTLHYNKGYASEAPLLRADENCERVQTLSLSATTDAAARPIPDDAKLPQWVDKDRQVLRFYGYFKEHVTESNTENHRIRKVVMYYYLEDDSMHVAEPVIDNSGIPQGQFIKRHRIKKDDGSFVSPCDFNVDCHIALYGREFHIVDVDDFTRSWLESTLGLQVPSKVPYPDDPLDVWRESMKRRTDTIGPPNPKTDDVTRFVEASLGKPSSVLDLDRLRQFLANNRKVLRFWCLWDDRQSLYGDRRPYVLHYYLEDDTVEINEVNDMNSGRDPFPVFLKRAPLPKGRHRFAYVTHKVTKEQCYAPEDFRLGQPIIVHERPMMLFDCDKFTREWYMENMGYGESELAPIDVKEEAKELPKPAMPPYNGYGTLKDSEQNCLQLVPKPPKKDLRKLINKDGMILRFVARFKNTDSFVMSHADADRRFILSYFMNDDTIAVYEPSLRNSGIVGGKFLERSAIYKPGTEETYEYKDLYVGACLDFHGRCFELLEADEYTYTFMENNKHMFIMADDAAIMKLLRAQVTGASDALRTAFIEMDKDGSGTLDPDELNDALARAGLTVTKHQVISLCRALDDDKSGTVSVEEFLNALGVSLEG